VYLIADPAAKQLSVEDVRRGMTELTDIFGDITNIRRVMDRVKYQNIMGSLPSSGASATLAYRFADLCASHGITDMVIEAAAKEFPENQKVQFLAAGRGMASAVPATMPTPAVVSNATANGFNQSTWINLRTTLSRQITNKDRIWEIADAANLHPENIDFTGSSTSVWHAIFDAAKRNGEASVKRLLNALAAQPELEGDETRSIMMRNLGM